MRRSLLWLAAVALGFILGWKAITYNHNLKFVPQAMDVNWISYIEHQAWGFGPGANETTLIVYHMPKHTQAAIRQGGLDWLSTLPENAWQGWMGRYREWYATPMQPAQFLTNPDGCAAQVTAEFPDWCPSVANYMDRYGFGIPIAPEVEAMVDQALFSEGAYYALGRIGLLIVIPDLQKIVFVARG